MDISNKKPRELFPDKPKYASNQWYKQNIPNYKEKHNEWSRNSIQRRIDKDPDAWYQKKRDEKNAKYKNDPEFAERRRQASRAYYQKKKAEKAQAEIEQVVMALTSV
jgi:hypothetical protein